MGEKVYNILIVEDYVEISELMKLHLECTYNIYQAYNGQEAIEIFESEKIHLVLLDIMLQKINGYDVLKHIREKSNIPLIIVSAKEANEEKVIGLNLGADDYIAKPFNPLELEARVNAQFRRFYKFGGATKESLNTLVVKDIKLDNNECCIYKEDKRIDLTNLEYKLIKLLMSQPGRIFSKKQIFEAVWEEEYVFDDNTIMVYISKLRDYIELNSKKPEYIITVRGLGYKFEKER